MLWLCQDSRILLELAICCRKIPVLLRTVVALFQMVTCIIKLRFAYMVQQSPWVKNFPFFFSLAYPTKYSPSPEAQARNLPVSHQDSSRMARAPFPIPSDTGFR